MTQIAEDLTHVKGLIFELNSGKMNDAAYEGHCER